MSEEITIPEKYLAQDDLYKLLYLKLLVQNVDLLRQKRQKEYDEFITAETIRFNNDIAAYKQASVEAKTRYNELVRLVEEKYQIKMSEWAFDDETGLLRPTT